MTAFVSFALVCLFASTHAADLHNIVQAKGSSNQKTGLRSTLIKTSKKVHDPVLSGWAQDAHDLESSNSEDEYEQPEHNVVSLKAHEDKKEEDEEHKDDKDKDDKDKKGDKDKEHDKDDDDKDKKHDKDDDDDEDDDDTQEDLDAARIHLHAAKADVREFKQDKEFEASVDKSVEEIANETSSPEVAHFLGDLRLEMRSYAKATYPAYLESRAEKAEKRVKELEGEISKEDKEDEKKHAHDKKEHKEKDGHDKEEEKTADAVLTAASIEKRAGETWAISFFANVVLLSVVFAMSTTKNASVSNHTWFVLDQVILIFLAVMYFQAFDSLLDFHGMGVHNAVVASVLHAVCILSMILLVAKCVKSNETALGVLCGAGAHVSSFCSIHAAAGHQNMLMGTSYAWTMAIFGMAVLALALAIIGFFIYSAKRRAGLLENDGFMDKTDDLENDFGSMAFSVVFTMFIRFLITDHHPKDDESKVEERHSASERTNMLIWMFVCLIIAVAVAKAATKVKTTTYAAKRIMNFVSTVVTMNCAWALLFWGEWEFFEVLFSGNEIKGKVLFAVSCTILCCVGLVVLTKVKGSPKSMKVALTALSLVTAWSWEGCFDAALEDMTDGVGHPAVLKITLTLVLFGIILPVYIYFVKPITGPAAEAIGA